MPTRYLSGLLLLLLGVGFLLDQFYGWHLVGTYWPALLILVGLNTLIRHPRHPWWPLVLMVLGVFALARTLDPSHPVRMNPWAVIGAALLIGFGQENYFNGMIRDVKLYNRALSDAQLRQGS